MKEQKNETIETLDMTDGQKSENVQDIPKTFFRPIAEIQEAYNREHGIVPKTIVKEIRELISNVDETKETKGKKVFTRSGFHEP